MEPHCRVGVYTHSQSHSSDTLASGLYRQRDPRLLGTLEGVSGWNPETDGGVLPHASWLVRSTWSPSVSDYSVAVMNTRANTFGPLVQSFLFLCCVYNRTMVPNKTTHTRDTAAQVC